MRVLNLTTSVVNIGDLQISVAARGTADIPTLSAHGSVDLKNLIDAGVLSIVNPTSGNNLYDRGLAKQAGKIIPLTTYTSATTVTHGLGGGPVIVKAFAADGTELSIGSGVAGSLDIDHDLPSWNSFEVTPIGGSVAAMLYVVQLGC